MIDNITIEQLKIVSKNVRQQIYQKFYANNQIRAAFIMIKNQSEFTIASVATGSKSLGFSFIKDDQRVIDQHAEVLAKRAFQTFLLQESQIIDSEFIYFDKNSQKYSLKQNVEIMMYLSQLPCGQCCSYQEQQNYGITSAKITQIINKKIFQNLNSKIQQYSEFNFRYKPGRSDLPVQKLSLSLSCSDKILKWNVLGLQGSKLCNIFMPIFIKYFFFEQYEEQDKIRFLKGISMYKRLKHQNKKLYNLVRKRFKKKQNIKMVLRKSKQNQNKTLRGQNLEDFSNVLINKRIEKINGKSGLLYGFADKDLNNTKAWSSICNKVFKFQGDQNSIEINQYKENKSLIYQVFSHLNIKPQLNQSEKY